MRQYKVKICRCLLGPAHLHRGESEQIWRQRDRIIRFSGDQLLNGVVASSAILTSAIALHLNPGFS